MQEIFVRASEFPRQFGHLSQTGNTVFVTHHGRETHVLLPIADYSELVAATKGEERWTTLSDQNLADWLPLMLIVTDESDAIVMANRTAHAMARRPKGSLAGCQLFDALPMLRQTIFENYYNHTVRTREPCSFELPGLFGTETWHRAELFRVPEGVALLARDVTDEIKTYRLADTKRTLIEAITAHGGIGHVWINIRGRIEQIDGAMSELLRLPFERVKNVPVVDLLPIGHRVLLREIIEDAMTQDDALRFETEFLSNDGSTIPAIGAIKNVRGLYGSEGAVMVVTRK